jgi:hypothetical protein
MLIEKLRSYNVVPTALRWYYRSAVEMMVTRRIDSWKLHRIGIGIGMNTKDRIFGLELMLIRYTLN